MKKYVFTETGEVRSPKKGEWAFNSDGDIEFAQTDLDYISVPILKREVIIETWKPKPGDTYCKVEVSFLGVLVLQITWEGLPWEIIALKNGFIFKHRADAQKLAGKFEKALEEYHEGEL